MIILEKRNVTRKRNKDALSLERQCIKSFLGHFFATWRVLVGIMKRMKMNIMYLLWDKLFTLTPRFTFVVHDYEIGENIILCYCKKLLDHGHVGCRDVVS